MALGKPALGMSLETLLWREASIATAVDGFVARVGGRVLDALDATAVAVRCFDREHHHLDTVAVIQRGALGVAHPARPRTELSAAAAARIAAWIEAGELERPGPRRSSVPKAWTPARDLLRGVADADGGWWLVPLAAHGGACGVLLVCADHKLDTRRVAEVSEPFAAVLAAELARRALQQRSARPPRPTRTPPSRASRCATSGRRSSAPSPACATSCARSSRSRRPPRPC